MSQKKSSPVARAWSVLLLTSSLCLVGCGSNAPRDYDYDGDGWQDEDDCAPGDVSIHPDADDPFGDGLDQNCDEVDGVDLDLDSFPGNAPDVEPVWDCADDDPLIYPGAPETNDDLIDSDCDGWDSPDNDQDGHMAGAEDCDDSDPDVFTGAPEVMDCVDNNCDGDIDESYPTADGDGDGFCSGADLGEGLQCCDGSTLGDCNDESASMFPGAPLLCDGIEDDDCDGIADANQLDSDGDAWTPCDGDCDDSEVSQYPGAPELCDGADNDCDSFLGPTELDDDDDSWLVCAGDCDDSDPAMHPGDVDGDGFSPCGSDGLPGTSDDDCDDGQSSVGPWDGDLDGWSTCAGDCDDASFPINPAATEDACDGLDNDCDGLQHPDDVDDDGDGETECGGDCDDGDPLNFSANSRGLRWSGQ